ncbi:3,4-dihydroxy-2-butanone-4-phosphate synthase [Anaplasma phagocytophilum]|uniref:3,4-dihydroxy-2-butanone 4-phosphate synthase n=2 Tax=Anaplasma phagocytophilum TaxID=948 RepID=A0A0F3NIN4_ANAPH|nr:3,4-dihydroxy-2-butanone-4-phosphate synthase [Anaplasma phagocytophilum str. ApMUC09]KJV67621.1 3,4-dihydroxy-2-butanone-4-phosphate synthase [Anaplasma phagocytophilum str. ApNP]SCV62493.1 3,4-dihydroxy-2-butanone 4-phosphate synthase [Anaplasma phagocytophilum]
MSFEPSAAVFSSIEEVVRDAAEGKVFVLLDDEERENEGDLVALADRVSPEAINMMIRYGSGIVCLAFSEYHAKKLGLGLMSRRNANDGCPAFTESIDARHGITTGVSASDRVATILKAVSDDSSADDIVTPGHVFPIVANPGGVLKRGGHTEAGVDIAKLAGAAHAAVICELMNPDGTMARLPEIMEFASANGIKVTTIKKLREYLSSS